MNLLQSFMSCMYPNAVRTDSIESMDNDMDQDCSFPNCSNIDEHLNIISTGMLQLTDKDLIYFRSGIFPTSWPIGCIRRYGCSQEKNVFVFEAGRQSPTGPYIFAFHSDQCSQLSTRLREKIEKSALNNKDARADRSQEPKEHKISIRPDSSRSQRKDASTSTDPPTARSDDADPRPLSYILIDFDTTKALSESAQAHAANRTR